MSLQTARKVLQTELEALRCPLIVQPSGSCRWVSFRAQRGICFSSRLGRARACPLPAGCLCSPRQVPGGSARYYFPAEPGGLPAVGRHRPPGEFSNYIEIGISFTL